MKTISNIQRIAVTVSQLQREISHNKETNNFDISSYCEGVLNGLQDGVTRLDGDWEAILHMSEEIGYRFKFGLNRKITPKELHHQLTLFMNAKGLQVPEDSVADFVSATIGRRVEAI